MFRFVVAGVMLGHAINLFGQQLAGSLEGAVTDPSGAAVSGASVQVIAINGATNSAARAANTDIRGRYRIGDLAPGVYRVRITSSGFAPFGTPNIDIPAGATRTLDARLELAESKQKVTVSDEASQVGVDPSQNAGQIVLRGSDLDAFSDDPEDLANELQMLAGPSPGPDGGQIFIDGFSAGIMPPKASIREVRVNQNPFSAEYDRVGFGRIDVVTKPGSEKYHGQASYDFADRALTARNPFLTAPVVPNYRQEQFAGNFGGPVSSRASFFIDANRRITDENSVVTYTSSDAALNPVAISSAVVAPSWRTSVSPRFDYAITPNHTLTLRYSWADTNGRNQGINTQTFDEASQAFTQDNSQHSIQAVESSVLGARAINDIRFQFLHARLSQSGVSTAPEVDVQGAFTSGGTFPLNYTDDNRSEFQDNLTILRGAHTIKLGGRLRDEGLTQQSTTNFNGRFIFSGIPGDDAAIDVYRQNQLLALAGYSQVDIAAQGFGPSEFLLTTGNPRAKVNMFDAGLYAQDDWRWRRNVTLSAGLRYEGQSGVSDHADFAPRVAIAWAPAGGKSRNPKTVIRAASGMFYDRFSANLLMNATLLNEINQTQYIIRNPLFYPDIPDIATLEMLAAQQSAGVSHVRYQVDSGLRVPYLIQTAAGIEHQLVQGVSFAVNYTNTRGVHELLTRDINAPLETAFNSLGEAIGPRPFGNSAGDIYQYEGSGVFRQNQLVASFNAKVSSRLSMFGYYVLNRAMSDTDGSGTMPSNPYDLRADYGRAAFDFRHRAFISATTMLPGKIRMAPFLFLQSGLPYNVTSGVDTNGDGNPNDDRPAFAQDLARPTVVYMPGFGAFDLAPGTLANAVIVPRNYLEGPGILSLTVRVSRSWSFGEAGRGGGNTGNDEIRGGEAIRNGG